MNRYDFYSNLQSYKKNDEIMHYGIIGQKWGKRRWQNSDGTFNEAGKERYFGKKNNDEKLQKKIDRAVKYKTKQINYLNKFRLPGQKKIDVDTDTLNKFYKAYYELPWYKRTSKNIIKQLNGTDADTSKVNQINKMIQMDQFNQINQINQMHEFMNRTEQINRTNMIVNQMNHQMFMGQRGKFDFKKLDESNRDVNGKSDEQYWKDKAEAEKYLDENYDRDFAEVIKDDYDTSGEWGNVDAEYKDFQENPLAFLRENSRDHKYSDITDHDMKKAEKEAEKINKKIKNGDYKEFNKIRNEILNNPKYKELFDEIDRLDTKANENNVKRMEEIFEDFNKNETENLANAGIMAMLYDGYYPNPTMSDLANNAWFYIYEDGNQGDNTAEYLYATIDKGIRARELDDLYDNLALHKNTIEDIGIPILKKDPVLSNVRQEMLNSVIDKKLDDKYDNGKSYWNLYSAVEGDNFAPTDKQKKDYAEAKNISKKLTKSCGNTDGWYYLNQAIENLGLSDTELSNMTQSDWDKVNAEVNRLKK